MTHSPVPPETPEAASPVAAAAAESGKDQEPRLLPAGLLQAILKWSALLFTLGGLSLHVAGYVYHGERLKAWGLDDDLFPKSVEWILIHGYYVTLVKAVKLWAYFKAIWWHLGVFCVLVTILSTANIWLMFSTGGKQAIERFRAWARSRGLWFMAPAVSFCVSATFCVAIAFAPALFVMLVYLPASMAISEARAHAVSQRAIYERGCSDTDPERRCLTLRRPGKPDLRGFLIESSESVLAIYLPERKAVQVVPREGVEIEVLLGAAGEQSSPGSSRP